MWSEQFEVALTIASDAAVPLYRGTVQRMKLRAVGCDSVAEDQI